jgi:hypothetical protein
MKIKLFTLPLFLLLFGCSSSNPGSTESSDMSDMPNWCEGATMKKSGYYYSCGFAKKKNPALSKNISLARSRGELTTAVETEVRQLIQDFMEESGENNESEVSEYAVSVGQTVTARVTSMSTIDEQKFGKDGVYYVLVKLDMNKIADETTRAVKNNKALSDKLNAMGKIDEMNQRIDSLRK